MATMHMEQLKITVLLIMTIFKTTKHMNIQ
jgi:hypothetical protein